MIRRFGRVVAALLMGLVLVGGPIAAQALDDGCVDGMVRHERDCVSEDRLLVLTEGSLGHSDLQTAVAPHDGRIFPGAAGVYTVAFLGARFNDLTPIMESLEAVGFIVYYDRDASRNFFP